ncbi:dipeptidase [Magnetofaba australis]|uniref:Putative peptidase M20 n=1 Tax=Magnetofaba australis IT-1 TaxID=1434232 RepID=A0A1Y2K5W5_9PROT|nr:dipeptidase [Magnetofaba australis]OSM04933.1 putative peptidase M20 [Magnetofaba australis IT-1]
MDRVLAGLPAQRPAFEQALLDYLRIPAISADPTHADSLQQCARHTAALLQQAGMQSVDIHQTAGQPVVLAQWRGAGPERPTVLVYGHYDVQPVDPLDLWISPPFEPRIADDRVFARGAMDDKGQVLMHILALGEILRRTGSLPVNVIFLIEGEEEIVSPNLPAFLDAHAELLQQADAAVISDTSMWDEGVPAITTSLRGMALIDVTMQGPNRDLHSGAYGGVIGNPLEALARLLASVKDDSGRILIPGFYDDVEPLDAATEQRLAATPFDARAFYAQQGTATGWGEAPYGELARLWRRPTFEINGLWGGYQGEGFKTVLPAQAHAKISMRLVAKQDPERIAALVCAYLRDNAPPWTQVIANALPGAARGVAFADDLPIIQAAQQALTAAFGREPVLAGEGVTIPIVADLWQRFGIPTALIGFGLPDGRAHSPNENLHLPTFHTGIESLVRFYYALAQ